jgi:hypothetical protein
MLTKPTFAAKLREFAKIPGATWINSAWSTDGIHLHSCTASREDAGQRTVFTRDRTGYWLTLKSTDLKLSGAPLVHLAAGHVFDEKRPVRATGASSIRIPLGKSQVLVKRLTKAIYRNRAEILELRLPDRTLTVPLKDGDGALVELDTCWQNARPGQG